MAISFVNSAKTGTATITMPTGIKAGDIIIIYAYRAALTSPSTPTGFTSISNQSSNSNSHKAAYKIADGTESGTSVTATNANVIQCAVYRGATGVGGAGGGTNAASTTTTITGITTFTVTDGSSWAVSFCGSAQATSQSTPAGTTIRGTSQAGTGSMALICDSNTGVSTWAGKTSTAGASVVGAGGSVELIANPIAIDATSNTTNVTNQTAGGTTTLSHIVGSGTNRALIVSIATWNNGGTGTGCSGVTYNGSAMTLVPSSGSTNGAFYTEQWYLTAPSSGTNNIVATVSGKTDKLGIAGVSFTGVNQSNPIDVNTIATGTSGTVTASLTTTAANEIMVDAVSHLSANTATSGTGNILLNDSASGAGVAIQYGAATTTGANSLSWTYPDPGDGWAYSSLAVKIAGAAPTVPTNLFFF